MTVWAAAFLRFPQTEAIRLGPEGLPTGYYCEACRLIAGTLNEILPDGWSASYLRASCEERWAIRWLGW